ncbi:hypothetical protein ColLi_01834 [Colletotrichum liriopes]|uniref:Uncharacterized protein n=1 Tax=Colletotrichum liriopes TaxID=708192 RepID=A0AA37GEK6_9PEZI|nr:hypothetical protein ColLi_01834 [Colletotrichum liriopes]
MEKVPRAMFWPCTLTLGFKEFVSEPTWTNTTPAVMRIKDPHCSGFKICFKKKIPKMGVRQQRKIVSSNGLANGGDGVQDCRNESKMMTFLE